MQLTRIYSASSFFSWQGADAKCCMHQCKSITSICKPSTENLSNYELICFFFGRELILQYHFTLCYKIKRESKWKPLSRPCKSGGKGWNDWRWYASSLSFLLYNVKSWTSKSNHSESIEQFGILHSARQLAAFIKSNSYNFRGSKIKWRYNPNPKEYDGGSVTMGINQ